MKICSDIIIKTSVEAILVTSLPTSKIFLSVEIRVWKTPSRIISQNLGSFQDKYLWRSSVLTNGLSLRFAVIKLMIVKRVILRDFTETYSEPTRVSKMEHLQKIINGWKQKAPIFAKSSILDVRVGSKYPSALLWLYEP